MSRLSEQLKRHEGVELHPYNCTAGKSTIGVGRNLDDVGLTLEECDYLLNNDITRTTNNLSLRFEPFNDIDTVRQDVLINMAFNMGVSGLLKFKRMLAAVELGDYVSAADEMLDSKWSKQVGIRSHELARQMVRGEYEL